MMRENFTSTVSHELHTPLLTIIFFLQQIIKKLSQQPFQVHTLPQTLQYCSMMMNQSQFM